MVAGAGGATPLRVGHHGETFAAPAFDLDFLLETKKLFHHFAIELKHAGTVSPQNFRHGAGLTQMGLPGLGVAVALDQAASLHVAAPVKVTVVIFTLFSSRRFHGIHSLG